MEENNYNTWLEQHIRPVHGYFLLPDRAIFRLEGEDRLRYLNGQVSNDVSKATGGCAVQACVLTAKGKLCANVRIWQGRDSLYVEASTQVREALHARLERYIIADDVTLVDESDEWGAMHILGGSEGIKSLRFGVKGRDQYLPRAGIETAIEDCRRAGLAALDGSLLECCRILCGVPKWGSEIDENTLPQEAGLERTSVDFHKGCYVGQEVVSRIQSVGHVNRHLVLFEAPVAFGGEISEGSEVKVGKITSVSPVFGLSNWIGMGYVKRGFDKPGTRLFAHDPENGASVAITVREFVQPDAL